MKDAVFANYNIRLQYAICLDNAAFADDYVATDNSAWPDNRIFANTGALMNRG